MSIEQSLRRRKPAFEIHQESIERGEAAMDALQKEIARTEQEIAELEREPETLQLEQAIRGLRERAEIMRTMLETSERTVTNAENFQREQLKNLPLSGSVH
ncbi:hypothetical protein K8R03_00275 [Candidatus Kaiserbacteria bacterium]|nr:hypothetical protein [Candidatus Kaiserbacteria bacterium]